MTSGAPRHRVRMTGAQRREQLLDIGRELFAERGYEATAIEEVAARADVSKPVVYEHFGGKDGLYAVVVDRELQLVLDRFTAAMSAPGRPRQLLERAALAEDEAGAVRLAATLAGAGVFRTVRAVSGPVPGARLVG